MAEGIQLQRCPSCALDSLLSSFTMRLLEIVAKTGPSYVAYKEKVNARSYEERNAHARYLVTISARRLIPAKFSIR